jgi:hypothetical protein
MTYELIETKTLGSTQSAITFTSIPQTYTDLYVLASLRSNRGGDILDILTLGFNSSTSNRTSRELNGDNGGVSTFTNTNGRIGLINADSSTANTFSSFAIYIPNYTSSAFKTASVEGVLENNASRGIENLESFLWSETAAITTLTLDLELADFISGSTVSLYGILKGSSGGVVVS